jgi:AcrR family transcriptional regulator
VFYEKGYHSTSINDITSLAGVALGTFYVYFDSKYNLYKYLLLQCSHMIRKNLSQAVENCKTRRDVERVGLKAWLEFALDNQYMYHIIWESLYIDHDLFVNYYTTFCAGYMTGLEKAEQDGELRDIDPEVLAYTLMGASNFLGLNWGLFKEDRASVDHVVEEFMKILDNGIFNPGFRPAEADEGKRPAGLDGRFRFPFDLVDVGHDKKQNPLAKKPELAKKTRAPKAARSGKAAKPAAKKTPAGAAKSKDGK